MVGRSWRILIQQSIGNGDSQPLPEALDLIDSSSLVVIIQVHEAATGEAPRLLIRHAPVNEEEEYLDFDSAIEVDLTATGRSTYHVEYFSRWVAWFTSGVLETNAVVTIDIIARG